MRSVIMKTLIQSLREREQKVWDTKYLLKRLYISKIRVDFLAESVGLFHL